MGEPRDALQNTPIIYELDIVRPEQLANERLKAKIARDRIVARPGYSLFQWACYLQSH